MKKFLILLFVSLMAFPSIMSAQDLDAATLAKIIQAIVLTASKVKSQSSAVRANNTAKSQMRR